MRNIILIAFVIKLIAANTDNNENRQILGVQFEFPQCKEHAYCFANDRDAFQVTSFATKTAYPIVVDNRNDDRFKIPNCRADKFWILARHGTRLPTKGGIKRFAQMEHLRDRIVSSVNDMKRKYICAEDITLLKAWHWNRNITIDRKLDLTTQGKLEMESIARNYRRRFPHVLRQNYDANYYYFRHTDRTRTRDSFRAFVNGLFGNEFEYKQIDANPPSKQPDLLLKGYAHCDAWSKSKKSLKKSKSNEIAKFKTSSIFLDMIDDFNARFGFNGSMHVDQIENIYDLCRYEKAWNPVEGSVWCSLFSARQLLIMEFAEEIKYHYKSNYGCSVHESAQCYTVNDALKRMTTNQSPHVVAYFTHSTAIQQFLTALGALKDPNPLTADQFNQFTGRKWRMSAVAPFAANVAIVKYDCFDGAKIQFFVNEQLLRLDWCMPSGICDLKQFIKQYTKYAGNKCDNLYCTRTDL